MEATPIERTPTLTLPNPSPNPNPNQIEEATISRLADVSLYMGEHPKLTPTPPALARTLPLTLPVTLTLTQALTL